MKCFQKEPILVFKMKAIMVQVLSRHQLDAPEDGCSLFGIANRNNIPVNSRTALPPWANTQAFDFF